MLVHVGSAAPATLSAVMQGLLAGSGEQRLCKPPWGGVACLPARACTRPRLRDVLTQAVRFGCSWRYLTSQERHERQGSVLAHSDATGIVVVHDPEGAELEAEQDWHIRKIDKRWATPSSAHMQARVLVSKS